MFQRIDGLRTLTLGQPGSELQKRLNDLVLAGIKTGTSSVDDGEYAAEQELFEVAGEQQWLVDADQKPLALIEFTSVEWIAFNKVPWDFVVSEGEGFKSVEHWQDSHKEFWSSLGINIEPSTEVICYRFRLVRPAIKSPHIDA